MENKIKFLKNDANFIFKLIIHKFILGHVEYYKRI